MAKVVPEIAVSDIERSLEFYSSLGFVKDNEGIVDDKGSQWYSLALGDAALWLIREDIVEDLDPDEERGNGITIYVSVDDVDAVYDKLKPEAMIVKDIETMWYGLRQFSVSDPDGYLLTINMEVAQEGSPESAQAHD
jgi:catechol 2,3-dioxygenase-like lactoylglutathione lyase family enzyme